MKPMKRLNNHPKSTLLSSIQLKRVFCAFLCTSGLLCTGSMTFSAENDTTELSQLSTTTPNSHFEYLLENRADPFVPFISEKAASSTVDPDEIVDSDGPLTGMQLFEPGQLTLVALLRQNIGDVAMVEDFTGKGYILLEGTKIGRRGVVKDIAPNSVIIEETAVTRAGKEIITKFVMTLKKEGEE